MAYPQRIRQSHAHLGKADSNLQRQECNSQDAQPSRSAVIDAQTPPREQCERNREYVSGVAVSHVHFYKHAGKATAAVAAQVTLAGYACRQADHKGAGNYDEQSRDESNNAAPPRKCAHTERLILHLHRAQHRRRDKEHGNRKVGTYEQGRQFCEHRHRAEGYLHNNQD